MDDDSWYPKTLFVPETSISSSAAFIHDSIRPSMLPPHSVLSGRTVCVRLTGNVQNGQIPDGLAVGNKNRIMHMWLMLGHD